MDVNILCFSMTLMLKKLLSLNIFLIYVNNVFRFCFIGIMLINVSNNDMNYLRNAFARLIIYQKNI